MDTPQALVEAFEHERRYLLALAYRMMGSATEAEDIVQDAFLRYRAAASDEIRSPRAYLSTIVTRLCLDELKSARVKREQYVGPWLPEPLPDAQDDDPLSTPGRRLELQESVTMAFLVLLESLSPLERAVFLLREVFDYGYPEVARMIGRSEAACRQSFHRAKAHVAERRPRFTTSSENVQRLTEGFLAAALTGDVARLQELLADDIVVWSDGGGLVSAATRPVYGRQNVMRFIAAFRIKLEHSFEVSVVHANGGPAILIRDAGRPFALVFVEGEQTIQTMYAVLNPEKLASFAAEPHPLPPLPEGRGDSAGSSEG